MDLFERRAFRACSLILLLVNVVLAADLTYKLLRYGPYMARILADFGTELPKLTIIVLSPWFQWVGVGLIALALLKETLANKRVTLTINAAILLALLILDKLLTIATLEGLASLLQSVTGQ